MTFSVPLLVGHRGLMARYPENTLPSLKAALDAGAAYVEFDLQMSRDQTLYLLHDDTFLRTSGDHRRIFDLEASEISAIHPAHASLFDTAFSDVTVPTLLEAMELVKSYPGARAMVEIKSESLDHWGMEQVMKNLLQQLTPYRDYCRVISFEHNAIAFARENSKLETGWVLEQVDEAVLQRAASLQPEMLACDYKDLPETGTVPPGPWEWMLYDIMEADLAFTYAAGGAALIETADVELLGRDKRFSGQDD